MSGQGSDQLGWGTGEPDEVHEVAPDAPLDLTGDEAVDAWRGVKVDDVEEVTGGLAGLLRSRSRALLTDLVRPHRRALVISSALIALSILCQLALPWLIQRGIDDGLPPLLPGGDGSLRPLLIVVAGIGLATVVGAVAFNGFLLMLGRVGQDVVLEIRLRLFAHFQRLSISFHERYTSGRVISRQTSDVEAIADLLGHGLINLISSGLLMVGIGVALLLLDLQLALVIIAAFPVLIALTRWFRSHAERAYRETREAVALVIVHFVESLGGIQAVHAFRREPRNQEIFEHLDDRYRAANLWSQRLGALYGPGVQGIGRLMTALVLLYGSFRVLDGDVTVGVLAAFLLYVRRFFAPMEELSQFYNLFQAASAALEKLSGVLDEAPGVPEPTLPVPLAHAAGEIRFEGVRFAYRDATVLPDLDLEIPAGQTVALVGATGAGKTTVARLAARFWDPTGGRVLLDGHDLRDLAEHDLRRAVVTVTQEGFLFSGTVADNIRLGRPGASDDEVVAAATAIGASTFIEVLPDGYASDVHQKGARLSAGQRQLVSFARAFLADPAVLILDEATSSLDVPSERLVQHALRTLLRDRTAVIIAHRLTTVEIADRVVVLDQGEVVEDGSPTELVGGGGRYAALHRAWADSLV
ncbi:MAG TPA: ABC transporter ATP-binding protein [Acidimicrobiales bacterium]|nr:ABC transporter ATP-binding protein [Acidimicrobiales bacterium]